MAKQVITKEDAEEKAAALEASTKEIPATDEPKPEAAKAVKFRTANVGLVYFPDKTTFAFHKPVLSISDPVLIEKLTEMASRTPTHIHLVE